VSGTAGRVMKADTKPDGTRPAPMNIQGFGNLCVILARFSRDSILTGKELNCLFLLSKGCFRGGLSQSFSNLAISLGLLATGTPAWVKALILDSAVPALPIIIAPACPMRFPGGADLPAIKAATGLG